MGIVEPDPSNDPDTDWAAFSSGYISVTPLTIDMTDVKALENIKIKKASQMDEQEIKQYLYKKGQTYKKQGSAIKNQQG